MNPNGRLAAAPSLAPDSIETISEVRVDANGDAVPDRLGDTVTVAGRAVVERGMFVPLEFTSLQDATAGIHVFLPDRPTIRRGDSVLVRGVVEQDYGLTQVRALEHEVVDSAGIVPPPLPLTVTAADNETYEGEFVRLRGKILQMRSNDGGKYAILGDQGQETPAQIAVFVPNRHLSRIDLGRFGVGDEIAVAGVVGQYDFSEPYTEYYQVLPRDAADLTHLGLGSRYLWTVLYLLGGGGIIAVVAILMLRSAVKRRTRQLEESKARFRRLAEATVEGIILHEAGEVIDVNDALAEMVGMEREELVGQNVETVLADTTREVQTEFQEGPQESVTEAEIVQADGTTAPVEIETKDVRVGDCRVHVLALRDITRRKKWEREILLAKREAEKANRMKSAFLANMSHEIRTPLTSVIGFAEVIDDTVDDLEEHLASEDAGALSRFARLIQTSGRRLLETLEGVLNLSKLQAGEMALTREPVNLAKEVEEVVALFERRAWEANVELHGEPCADLIRAEADTGGVRMVLRNLISNGLKYSDEGGQVWVRARNGEGSVVLEVEDTGIGMEPSKVAALFEAFKQESEGKGREYEGTGLGLAVTKRLVKEMGGTIEVDTEKGVGSTFVVTLPTFSEAEVDVHKSVEEA